jgi:hypothetical protein
MLRGVGRYCHEVTSCSRLDMTGRLAASRRPSNPVPYALASSPIAQIAYVSKGVSS